MTAEVIGPIAGVLADHAASYAAAGIAIFPANPATKAPLTRHGMKDATTDPGQVAAWWRQHPDALIAARIPPGVLVLDVDPRHGGHTTWQRLQEIHGPRPATRRHQSGRGDGGGHIWFNHPGGKLTTTRLNTWAAEHGTGQALDGKHVAGIDLLHHDHRYTILPPSPHPDTGLPYVWLDGPDHPLADLPAWLTDILTPSAPVNGTAATTWSSSNGHHGDESIADWYSSTISWRDLLGRHGWQLLAGDGDTDGSVWRHPQATNDKSATIRHGCLFVYSPNTPFDETTDSTPHGYTRFRASAVLEHAGDLQAAGRAARDLKHGPRPPAERFDPHDLIDDNPTTSIMDRAGNAVTVPVDDPAGEPWADPTPLVEPDVPDFPLHALPAWIGDHCDAVADALQIPVDLCAQLALGVLATITQGHANIELRPGWTEPANLYLATVMPSGAGKSPADRAMVGPLRRLEAELLELTDNARRELELAKKIAVAKAKAAHTAAEKGDGSEDLRLAALEAAQAVDDIEEPTEPRLLVSDVTPEMLAVLLDRHQGRLAIVSTEAELYDLVLGAYGARPNIGVFLKGWSGDEIIVDRKGSGGQPGVALRIPEALLTISITVQPAALDLLQTKPELVSRGFVPRFMHVWPQSLVGQRDYLRPVAPIATTATYTDRILQLGHQAFTWQHPATLRLDPEASYRFLTWRQHIEARIGLGSPLEHLAEFAAKLAGSTGRLAGLLHLAHGRHTTPITTDTVEQAIEIGEYWLAHADAMSARWMTPTRETEGAQRILAWIADTRPETFTRRPLMDAYRRRFYKAGDIEPSLTLLVDRGWIRQTGMQTNGTKHPIPIYQPHPDALGGDPT